MGMVLDRYKFIFELDGGRMARGWLKQTHASARRPLTYVVSLSSLPLFFIVWERD